MPVPDFSPGEVLTAAAMDSIGLWLVGSYTVTGGSTVIICNSCFSSNYKNYRIVADINCSTDMEFRMQMRDGTGADGSANYSWQRLLVDGAALTAQRSTGITYGIINFGNAETTALTCDVFSPNISGERTFWQTEGLTQSSTVRIERLNTIFGANKAFTGFQIERSTGTFDGGTIKVYGYRD